MRPLMATFLDPVRGEVATGYYDERLAITLDAEGQPLVERVRAETLTKVVDEPADDDRVWALETETRVVSEPADDDRIWAESLQTGLPPADDTALGLVSF